MIQAFIRNLPKWQFWLANLLFWLVLNTVAADHTHRLRVTYGRESDWFATWLDYLPWWGNWALMTPLIIAAVRTIKIENQTKWRFATNHFILMIAAMSLYWALTVFEVSLINSAGQPSMQAFNEALSDLFLSPMHLDVLVYIAVASLGLTILYYQRAKQHAVANEQLTSALLKVELQALKSQLSPHFLFNTLNTISGLVRLGSKQEAVRALSELSTMFRKVLENQQRQLTSVADEIDFIESYLAIQQLRFEDKLMIRFDVDSACREMKVPFMLLHTLVENAVQHGSQLESNHNPLNINVSCHDDRLEFSLSNKVATSLKHEGFGIGIENCRARLKHIYGGDFRLLCKPQGTEDYLTRLSIPGGASYA